VATPLRTTGTKQFDLVVFRAELALLRIDPAFQGLRARITEVASLLEELGNVPMVAAEMACDRASSNTGIHLDVLAHVTKDMWMVLWWS
jgi:hypothetical protein